LRFGVWEERFRIWGDLDVQGPTEAGRLVDRPPQVLLEVSGCYMKRELYVSLSGIEVDYTSSSMLLVKDML